MLVRQPATKDERTTDYPR